MPFDVHLKSAGSGAFDIEIGLGTMTLWSELGIESPAGRAIASLSSNLNTVSAVSGVDAESSFPIRIEINDSTALSGAVATSIVSESQASRSFSYLEEPNVYGIFPVSSKSIANPEFDVGLDAYSTTGETLHANSSANAGLVESDASLDALASINAGGVIANLHALAESGVVTASCTWAEIPALLSEAYVDIIFPTLLWVDGRISSPDASATSYFLAWNPTAKVIDSDETTAIAMDSDNTKAVVIGDDASVAALGDL